MSDNPSVADPFEEPLPPKGPVDRGNAGAAFPLVGIGASAGGLEALTELFTHVPADTGMGFLVVLHLDPTRESQLVRLLAKHTTMRVAEAEDGEAIEPNHVYVIPPGRTMRVEQGVIRLTERGDRRYLHLPVDLLFRSLALDQQERVVAVVLSGTGSDGTQGVCELKAMGAITFAQDLQSAAHAGMPRSACDSGCVDFVLPPAEIATRLAEIGSHPYLESGPASAKAIEAHQFLRVLSIVRDVTGVDFSLYRDTTIKRRIGRRMALRGVREFGEYADLLKGNHGEVDALYHDLLINVTSFFRDPEMFEALKTDILPELARSKSAGEAFRIWVPGCSTGQEAFSLAMTVIEFYDSQPSRPPIQIFATDLSDQTALDKARAGVYPEGIEAEVSPERLRRFFRREDHLYRIDKSIRDMCVFARHNVTTDPPFSHMDLISCRNVLIYLTSPLQQRVLPTFHYALSPHGYLILGGAETIGEHTDLFATRDRANRIYSRKATPPRQAAAFPSTDYRNGLLRLKQRAVPMEPVSQDFQREADRMLLGRFAPPGVLLDEHLDVVQFRGRTSPFLEPAPGDPTTNVLKMAREGLRLELRNALMEVRKTQRTARRDGLQVAVNGTSIEVSIEVLPVTLRGGSPSYLVLFDQSQGAREVAARPQAVEPAEAASSSPDEVARELVHLRQELASTREYLQSMLEQQDAINEELRSANEEILSANEELQSTNEEVETAKEELHSTNEELTTVNEQLQRRNLEIDQANNDLLNLLASAEIAVVMVGADLRIRRFTPPARKVMALLPTDVGRPIADIQPAALVTDLEPLVQAVMDSVQVEEREVMAHDGRWYLMRVHPYRTADNRIDGAVLVMVDIDEMRRDQEMLKRQAALLAMSRDAIIIRDADHRVVFWNKGAEEMYGIAANDAHGRPVNELLRIPDATWTRLNDQLDQASSWQGEITTRRGADRLRIEDREVLIRDEFNTRSAILAIHRDVSDLTSAISSLKEADRRKNEFLAILAHELRNPLAPVRNAVEIMRLASDDPAAVERAREVIDRQSQQLSRIVDDLIDVSRIVEKKIELRPERVSLAMLLQTAMDACRSVISANRQQLTITMPPQSLILDGDRTRLAQILVNLLLNAAKFTEAGGNIWIEAARLEREGHPHGEVELRVRDDGIGISPDLLPHIFEIFTQGARRTRQGRGGLGVGLSLVRSLVEMHGGSIDAESDGPNTGAEFIVRLPLAGDGGDGARTEHDNSVITRRRVIVVDDNADQAESLATLLHLMGHETRVAEDGPTALRLAAEFDPDVMLIDIGLPGMSGHDVARQLRESEQFDHVLLVAQSGWGHDHDRERSQSVGFAHHLVKPLDRDALEQILREA